MSDRYPSFDEVIDYRRRRLVAQLDELGLKDTEEARAAAAKLLLDYLGDEEIRAAFAWAVREGNG